MVPPPSRVVSTKYGRVVGRRQIHEGNRQVDAFLGIPFAAPPVGALRFKKPVPPEPWTGVREATSWAPRAIQSFFLPGSTDTGECEVADDSSEDCLYLNVFTPVWQPPENGFPVMVFIHGGGFILGDAIAYGSTGICRHLVSKDVVVVTIQYRVGYLGFYTTGDAACPGNYGLWDQTAALQWVHDNIRAFGGDEKNVTLFGQSAGGASTDFLWLSPHSNKLFHKVAPMAGVACASWALNPRLKHNCEQKAAELGITVACNQELMRKLREVDAAKLVTEPLTSGKGGKGVELECTPCIDGDFLPEDIAELRKKAPPKPCLIGLTRYEATLFLMWSKLDDEAKIRHIVGRMIPDSCPQREKRIDDFLKLYIDPSKQNEKSTIIKAFIEAFSDHFLNLPTYQAMSDIVKYNGKQPTYSYRFDYAGESCWGPFSDVVPHKEATHSVELIYLFGKGLLWNVEFDENDSQMINMFTTAYTNFAKYGDPNGRVDAAAALPVKWEKTTAERPERHLIIDLVPQMSDCYFEGRPRRYAELIERIKAASHI